MLAYFHYSLFEELWNLLIHDLQPLRTFFKKFYPKKFHPKDSFTMIHLHNPFLFASQQAKRFLKGDSYPTYFLVLNERAANEKEKAADSCKNSRRFLIFGFFCADSVENKSRTFDPSRDHRVAFLSNPNIRTS